LAAELSSAADATPNASVRKVQVQKRLKENDMIETRLLEAAPNCKRVGTGLPVPDAKLPVRIGVDAGGGIWGTGKYQELDPGWLEAAALWLEHLIIGKHSFPPAIRR
jgi:hypothetical protein